MDDAVPAVTERDCENQSVGERVAVSDPSLTVKRLDMVLAVTDRERLIVHSAETERVRCIVKRVWLPERVRSLESDTERVGVGGGVMLCVSVRHSVTVPTVGEILSDRCDGVCNAVRVMLRPSVAVTLDSDSVEVDVMDIV